MSGRLPVGAPRRNPSSDRARSNLRVVIHLARHARVDSHRGDVPLAETGRAESEALGRRIAEQAGAGERVSVLHTQSRRAIETAVVAHAALVAALGPGADVAEPAEQPALRNPDVYVAGWRIEFGSSPDAIANQVPGTPVSGDDLPTLGFWREWFAADNRVGSWVHADDVRGEDADTVARRLIAWASTLRDASGSDQRVLAVSHSPNMRALLKFVLGDDPGEPEFTEDIVLAATGGADAIHVTWRDRSVQVPAPY